MVTYNPKDWFTLIIQFHKSDTFRQLFVSLVCIGLYAASIVYTEENYLHLNTKNPTVMHSILGFVLSMLLVFRTNSAYDRWWEGRKIWGSVVNNSRNLALKLSTILVHEKDKAEIKHLIIGRWIFRSMQIIYLGSIKHTPMMRCIMEKQWLQVWLK